MARNEFSNEALPSAAFVQQVGAIREGAFCVRTAAFSPDFEMPEDASDKARISLIHRHRRLTATLSLAAVLGMMTVPVMPGAAYATDLTNSTVNQITVSGNDLYNVNSGGVVSGATISGVMNVNNSGVVSGFNSGMSNGMPSGYPVIVGPGGEQNIFNGGKVIGNTDGGFAAGGVAVASGGVQNVYSGGSASQVVVAFDGVQNVGKSGVSAGNSMGGGTVIGGNIISGGIQYVYDGGKVSAVGVNDGGIQNIYSGATVNHSGGGVNTGGTMNVYGGSVTNVTINGGSALLSGGTMDGEVMSGGVWEVFSGGKVTGASVESGGTMNIHDGDVANFLIGGSSGNSGGTMNVYGGSVVSGAIEVGGVQNVRGGKVGDLANSKGVTVSSSGTQNVFDSGSVEFFAITAGGTQNVSGGTVLHGTVSGTSAVQNIFGGTVTSALIETGGVQNVSGGVAKATTISGGTANVSSGGTLEDMNLVTGSAVFASGAQMAGSSNVFNNGAFLTGVVTMADAATNLTVNATSAMDVAAEFKGAGKITVSGGNSATMSAVNSGFNGVIDVQSGAIIGGANYALGNGAVVNAASGASVNYGSSGASAYSAVVRGLTGSGTQTAPGDLTIALDDGTYVMDGQLITSGALIVKGAPASRLARAVIVDGVDKGAQVLNNSSGSVGSVKVEPGGALIIGDSKSSGAILTASSGFTASGNGALIGGFGTLDGNVTITNGAVLAPAPDDTQIGNLTIDGNLTINSGVLQAKLGENNGSAVSDRVNVSGSASMTNTTVEMSVVGDAAKVAEAVTTGDKLAPVISASGGLTANNNTVNFVDTALLNGTMGSDGSIDVGVKNITDVKGVEVTDNRRAVYGGMQGNSGLLAEMIKLGVGANKISRALDSLTGEVYAAAAAQAQGTQMAIGRQMLSRLAGFYNYGDAPAAGSEDGPHNLWFGFGASQGQIDGDDKIGTAEADVKRVEAALGYHHAMDNGWGVGAALQFGFGEVDVDDRWSQSDVDSVGFTLYGSKAVPTGMGDLRFTFGGNYSHYTVDAERWAMLDERQHLSGHQSGDGYGLFLETAHRFQVSEGLDSRIFLEPFLGLRYDALKMDSMTESGGNAALEIDADKMDNFSTDLGLRFIGDLNETVSMNAGLSWTHTFGDTETWTKTRFVDGGSAFNIQGNSASEDELNIGLGATFRVGEGAGINVGYDGVIGDNSHSHGGKAVLDIRW